MNNCFFYHCFSTAVCICFLVAEAEAYICTRYERKKAGIQDERYEQALDQAAKTETALLTDDQLEKLLYPYAERFIDIDGYIDVDMLCIVSSRVVHLKIGHNKAYRIARLLRFDHPDQFE